MLMLLDGHAMVYRAWYAIKTPMTVRSTGQEVRGVYNFAHMLRRAIDTFRPDQLAIAFDLPSPTFRHKLFPAYKAHRPEMPQDLREQFPLVRRLVEAFQIPIYELEGLEADDLLGTLSAQAEEEGIEVMILTGDTDVLQLVSPTVRVALQYRVGERIVFDQDKVAEKYGGLTPEQLIHLKALRGDPSDNIPGVAGVGEKTATRLLQDFGSVENIYLNLDSLPDKQRRLLESKKRDAFQGLELVRLVRHAPITLDLERSRWGTYRRSEVIDLLREWEFFSLVSWVPEGTAGNEEDTPVTAPDWPGPGAAVSYTTVDSEQALDALTCELATCTRFAFDVETKPAYPGNKGVDPMRADLVGVSVATAPGRAWYIPVGHSQGRQLPKQLVLARLASVFRDTAIPKIAHNGNYDLTVMLQEGLEVANLAFDTMLAAHMLGRKAVGLGSLVLENFGIEMTPITELIGTSRNQKSFGDVEISHAAMYSCAAADMTFRCWQLLDAELHQAGLEELFSTVEMPLVPILVDMQRTGIKLDAPLLADMSQELEERLNELEELAYEAVGHRVNLRSPAQLGELIFDELRLHERAEWSMRPKRTRTGAYATDASVLDTLKSAHPVISVILQNRQLTKLKSTYVDALPALVHPQTGRVHTTYRQAGAITGRVSSIDPNLQNIPVRTEEGRRIRQSFIPEPAGWMLMAADYSQIELRVLAHLSQDPTLLDAFQQDTDIHSATASQVFGVPLDAVTPEQRRIAKVLNFGVIYGVSGYGIAQQTQLTIDEGRRFIKDYFERYPGAKDYVERTKRQASEQGYVETLLGRRRATPEVNSRDPVLRQAAEREAVNMPIQGTAAEIMKLAMIRVHEGIKEKRLASRLLLQVHDELILEVPSEEIEGIKDLVQTEMPAALKMTVPLRVAVKLGSNWGALE